MRRTVPALLLALAGGPALSGSALAHGPTPQKVDQTITIRAAPDAVWKVVGPFGGIGTWHPDVATVETTGGDAGAAYERSRSRRAAPWSRGSTSGGRMRAPIPTGCPIRT